MYFELFILRKLPHKPLVESISFGLLAPFQPNHIYLIIFIEGIQFIDGSSGHSTLANYNIYKIINPPLHL